MQSSVVRGLPVHMPLTKGAAAVGKSKKREVKLDGNVVETYKIGQTTIRICDDYVAQTPEEIDRILDDFHAVGWAIIESRQRSEGEQA